MIVAKLNGRSLSAGLTYIKGGKGADLINHFSWPKNCFARANFAQVSLIATRTSSATLCKPATTTSSSRWTGRTTDQMIVSQRRVTDQDR